MAGLNYKSATFWENKFRTPSGGELVGALTKPHAHLVDVARRHFLGNAGVREELVWQGLPWRWTFAFRHEADPTRPWAYVVPEPGRPRVVLPVTMEELARFPVRKLSKVVRDPLAHGVEVDGVRWVEWELASRAIVDEVLALVVAVRASPVAAGG